MHTCGLKVNRRGSETSPAKGEDMKQRTSETTYQLTFIPRGEDTVVDRSVASDFADQLHTQFGYTGNVEVNPMYEHQHIVHLPVDYDRIPEVVEFTQAKGFGESVAELWWLNSVQSFNPWSMVTGINTATIPVSDWISELPR